MVLRHFGRCLDSTGLQYPAPVNSVFNNKNRKGGWHYDEEEYMMPVMVDNSQWWRNHFVLWLLSWRTLPQIYTLRAVFVALQHVCKALHRQCSIHHSSTKNKATHSYLAWSIIPQISHFNLNSKCLLSKDIWSLIDFSVESWYWDKWDKGHQG